MPLTKPQRDLYWREWSAAKKAAALHGDDLTDADRHALHEDTLWRDLWRDLQARDPGVTEPQARAAARAKSSTTFSNAQLDKVLATFRAISHPADLHTQIDKQHQPRKRLLWWIRHNCYEEYARALSLDKFHTEHWDTLPYEKLQQLHMTLKNRANAQTKTARAASALECGARSAATPLSDAPELINVARETVTESDPF